VKRPVTRPRIKRIGSEALADREVVILGILSLWRTRSRFFSVNIEGPELDAWFASMVKLLESSVDDVVKISAACSFRLTVEVVFMMAPTHAFYSILVSWMKRALFVSFRLFLFPARSF
jgi:hypothetical protein